MKIVMFYHSLASDWNHGNAHFLRGVVTELIKRGHDVKVYEPSGGWSLQNLITAYGTTKAEEYKKYYPLLKTSFYDNAAVLPELLNEADLVIVHEWNTPEIVAEIGNLKSTYGYKLLFHDTHHRAISDLESMKQFDLSNYDGALVFGNVLGDVYKKHSLISQSWTWHEAADTNLFHPGPYPDKLGDLVWIGNWGDDERTEELMEYLIRPVKELGLKAKVYGVRYPPEAIEALNDAGISYGGWLPNYMVPQVFSRYRVTVHIPRRPYVEQLPGIPTIRPFEAMACGIPLVCAPWQDTERLFNQCEQDYLTAFSGTEMKEQLKMLLSDTDFAATLSKNALNNIRERHTCEHRVDQLEKILELLGVDNVLIYPSSVKA